MSKWIKNIDRTKEMKNQIRELERTISKTIAVKVSDIIEMKFNIKPQIMDSTVIAPLEKSNICFICHPRSIKWFVCGTTINKCYISSNISESTTLDLESLTNKIYKIISRSIQFDRDIKECD